MRILAIRGENLASLYGPFELRLDTGPIAEAGLFSVSGPTGAGKSTLMDALCLALFGKTPRLGERGRGVMLGREGDDPALLVEASDERDLVSRGTGGGHAEVDFEGVDGKAYRARWSVHRSRNRAGGKLQAVRVEVTDVGTGEALAGTVRERDDVVPRLLGYSFDEFRRAVVLPQFEFTAFLKARPDERAAILERVTGTDVYTRLSVAAFRRAAEEAARLEDVTRRASEVRLLSEDERKEAAERHAFASREEEAAQAAARAAADALRWHDADARNAADVAAADEAVRLARARRDAAEPARVELAAVERSERLRPTNDAAARTARELEAARQRRAGAERTSAAAGVAAKDAETTEATARAAVTAAVDALEAARPEIRKAQALDASIADALKRSSAASEDRLRADAEAGAAVEHLRGARTAAVDLQARRDAAASWLQAHAAESSLAAEWPRWQAALGDHARLVADLARGEEAAASTRKRLDEARELRKVAAASVTRLDAEFGPLEERARQSEAACADDDLPALRRAHDGSTARRDALKELASLSAEAARARRDRDQAEAEAAEAAKTLREVEKEVARSEKEVAAADSALEAARAALQLTIATLDLEGHRDTLVDGEPCPLCGAKEHPYARKAPGETLRKRQQEVVGRHVKDLEALRKAGVEIQKRATRADEQGRKARAAGERHEASLRAANERYAKARGASAIDGVPARAADAGEGLARLLADAGSEARASRQALDAAIVRKQAADAARKLVEGMRQDIERERKAFAEADREAERAQAEAARAEEQVRGLVLRRDGAEVALDPPLSFLGAWRGPARGDAPAFARTCARVAEDHASRGGEVREAERALGPAREALEATRAREEEKRRAAADAAGREKALAAEVSELRAQRTRLLGGGPASEHEVRLETGVREARARLEEARAGAGAASQEVARRLQELSDASARLEEAARAAAAAEAALSGALAASGLDRPTLVALLARGAEWIERTGAELRGLDRALEQAVTTRAERVRRAEDHVASGRPSLSREEAARRASESEKAARDAHAQLVEVRVRLQADAEGRQIAASLAREREAQQAVATRWQKLSEVIGSADGKKFRSYAQGLTLDALLLQANHRLRDLAPRYGIMRVPGQDLELQVVDHDLGDEVRSVNGLSGGESFLVSLALALALASIATRVTQSRTLFIDEGFGTLDRDTLEHAMVALESLRASGRTVGVISHVPELHERIGVRVDVVRTGVGRSRVVVPA